MARSRCGWAPTWTLLFVLIPLSGCGLLRNTDTSISFQDIMPETAAVHYVQRLDTEGDGQEEWLLFYRYDIPSQGEGEPSHSPIGGAVYKGTPTSPPNLLAYPLVPQDLDYLGEEAWWGALEDFLKGDSKLELVVRSGRSRGAEEVFSLGIFQWRSDDGSAPSACPEALQMSGGYLCLGFFRGSGGVRVEGDRVVVLDRSGLERSQLAIKKVYAPVDGSYLTPDRKRLRDPIEQSIDFAFGMPKSPAQSPYPEKAVLAFYLALGRDNATARSYLSDASDYKANMDERDFGTGIPLKDLRRVLVKSVGYTPDEVAEQAHQDRQVLVSVTPITNAGEVRDEAGNTVNRQVSWVVRWEPLEQPKEGQELVCGWRLLSYTTH